MSVIAQRGWDQFLVAQGDRFLIFDVEAGRVTNALDADALADVADSGEWVPFDGPVALEQQIAAVLTQQLSLALFEAGAVEHHGLLVSLHVSDDAAALLAIEDGEPAADHQPH